MSLEEQSSLCSTLLAASMISCRNELGQHYVRKQSEGQVKSIPQAFAKAYKEAIFEQIHRAVSCVPEVIVNKSQNESVLANLQCLRAKSSTSKTKISRFIYFLKREMPDAEQWLEAQGAVFIHSMSV